MEQIAFKKSEQIAFKKSEQNPLLKKVEQNRCDLVIPFPLAYERLISMCEEGVKQHKNNPNRM